MNEILDQAILRAYGTQCEAHLPQIRFAFAAVISAVLFPKACPELTDLHDVLQKFIPPGLRREIEPDLPFTKAAFSLGVMQGAIDFSSLTRERKLDAYEELNRLRKIVTDQCMDCRGSFLGEEGRGWQTQEPK